MKPFTVAAGLETGTLTGDESYYCGGYLHVGDNDIGCHLRSGHGTESTMDAIANSCNVALMEMAEKIGVHRETLRKYENNPLIIEIGILLNMLNIYDIETTYFFDLIYGNLPKEKEE